MSWIKWKTEEYEKKIILKYVKFKEDKVQEEEEQGRKFGEPILGTAKCVSACIYVWYVCMCVCVCGKRSIGAKKENNR